MAKTLVFHIGWRKTGSSALQSFIFENTHDHALQHLAILPAGRSLQKRVIGAPSPADPVPAHHGLAGLAFRERCDQAWQRAAPFVAASPLETFLITSEILPAHLARDEQNYDRLAHYLSIFDRVRILCWVRRQDEYAISLAVQAAKHGGTGRERTTAAPMNWPRDADYCRVLEKIATVLPGAEIVPRIYDGAASDVIGEAIGLLGLDRGPLKAESPARLNARVPPQIYRLQITTNRHCKAGGIAPGPHQRVLIDGAAAAGIFSRHTEPAVPFTRDQRQRIIDRYCQSNRQLCAAYGIDSGHFEPSAGQLDELPDFNIPDRVTADFAAILDDGLEAVRTAGNTDAVDLVRHCLAGITEGHRDIARPLQ